MSGDKNFGGTLRPSRFGPMTTGFSGATRRIRTDDLLITNHIRFTIWRCVNTPPPTPAEDSRLPWLILLLAEQCGARLIVERRPLHLSHYCQSALDTGSSMHLIEPTFEIGVVR
jgi:hypothetical protein